ncbi:MAG: 30S ribosomal protein S8 [Elusimicrobia bacterium]|nr:30S ribosomal protein S8 [Elusimicrobiota bacterium]
MSQDPIADFLTAIRNANSKLFEKVDVPSSKLKVAVARVLKEEGLIANYKAIEERGRPLLRIYLRYTPDRQGVLRKIERYSRPGLRVYRICQELPRVEGGLGVAVVSTSRGVMTDKNARKLGIGGEVLCAAS